MISIRRRWTQLALLVPVASVLTAAGAGGVRTAQGCTGGAPSEGWNGLRVLDDGHAGEAVAVATDGFVLLHGAYYGGALDPNSPGVSVRVTDEAGEALSGQLRVVKTDARTEWVHAYLGWKADASLEIGSKLKLTWSVSAFEGEGGADSAPMGGTVDLEVISEPTPLPTPTVSVDAWVEVSHGVGPLVDCTQSGGSCGPVDIQVPTQAVRRIGVETSWQAPVISGVVAWDTWAETSKPADGFTLSSSPLLIHRRQELPVSTGVVAFEDDASEFCVVAVVKDLVSGEERRSEPRCELEQQPSGVVGDHALSSCDEPPTLEAVALWCEGRRDEPRCVELAPGDGGAGGTPSIVEPTGDAGRAEGGAPVSPETHDDDPSPAAPTASASGCQLVPAPRGFGFALVSLSAATAFARRRRGNRGAASVLAAASRWLSRR